MLLATWPLPEFANYLQIISWIILPVLSLAIIITMVIHYNRSKRKNKADLPFEALLMSGAQTINSPGQNQGAHIFFDHTGLIRKYQDKLSVHHARYAALQQDYRALELKYIQSRTHEPAATKKIKNPAMEDSTEQKPAILETVIPDDTEKENLRERIAQMDRTYNNMEAENIVLLQQINILAAKKQEETDVVHELTNEMRRQDYVISQLRNDLVNTESELRDARTLYNTQSDQNIYLQGQLRETREQNEFLQAGLMDNKEVIIELRQQLDGQQAQLTDTIQKLEDNRQMLKKLHRVMAGYIGGEDTQVIELKPVGQSSEMLGWG